MIYGFSRKWNNNLILFPPFDNNVFKCYRDSDSMIHHPKRDASFVAKRRLSRKKWFVSLKFRTLSKVLETSIVLRTWNYCRNDKKWPGKKSIYQLQHC